MLTKDILFGMNIMTLAGFALMGLSLSLNRTGQIGARLSVGLMCAGTALVFFGLYAGSEMPVPTPTSRIRPPTCSAAAIAARRPRSNRAPKTRS